jgi:dethiobiotin synthetase
VGKFKPAAGVAGYQQRRPRVPFSDSFTRHEWSGVHELRYLHEILCKPSYFRTNLKVVNLAMTQPSDLQRIFVTGIGTGVGKTFVSAVLAETFQAQYWKPIQAGLEESIDSKTIASLISGGSSRILPETYRLRTPVSPHHAAAIDHMHIDPDRVMEDFRRYSSRNKSMIIEGAGGVMVPLVSSTFYIDLIQHMDIPVIIVSNQYLGSINHSLLTAGALKQRGIRVLGWIFNMSQGDYEDDIVSWTAIPSLLSLGTFPSIDASLVLASARTLSQNIANLTPEALHVYG